jgi:hypothetical protein
MPSPVWLGLVSWSAAVRHYVSATEFVAVAQEGAENPVNLVGPAVTRTRGRMSFGPNTYDFMRPQVLYAQQLHK